MGFRHSRRITRRVAAFLVQLGAAVAFLAGAAAAPVTADLEYREIQNVGAAWITVPLENTYASAVPVCTYNTVSTASRSALPRIQNITSSSFQLRIQEFTGGSNPTAATTPGTVYCVIADEGPHVLADGRRFEAFTILSDQTTGQAAGNWNFADSEDASSLVRQSYANPVTMAMVISANDAQPSAIFASDCDQRGNPPFNSGQADGICVGKHIGQINGSRVPETIGVIIAEAGSGTSNGVFYQFTNGPQSIDGIGTNANTGYSVAADFDAAVVTQVGENGGQGGWATLVGADPLPSGFIRVSIDEEVVAGDTSRRHIDEEVDFFAFRDDRSIVLGAEKSVEVWDPSSAGLYAAPGNDVAYTLTIRNSGNAPPDSNSIFIVDPLPAEVAFFNGDFDPGDGDPNPILFIDAGSTLTFNYAADARFSNAASAPGSFAACAYTPTSGYDPNVRFVCLNPKGGFAGGPSGSEARFRFRARIE